MPTVATASPRQGFRVTDWREYDASLRGRELDGVVTDEAIASWKAEPRTTRGGQPTYPGVAILTALILRAMFRLALRQTEGLIGSVMKLLGLGLDLAVPDHSTLSRRAATVAVPRPRASPGSGPLHLSVDSTGLKLCGAGKWLHERHGTRVRRSWRELHLRVDAGTGRIVASSLTTKDVHDGSQAFAAVLFEMGRAWFADRSNGLAGWLSSTAGVIVGAVLLRQIAHAYDWHWGW